MTILGSSLQICNPFLRNSPSLGAALEDKPYEQVTFLEVKSLTSLSRCHASENEACKPVSPLSAKLKVMSLSGIWNLQRGDDFRGQAFHSLSVCYVFLLCHSLGYGICKGVMISGAKPFIVFQCVMCLWRRSSQTVDLVMGEAYQWITLSKE